jgi:hypothetical protein
VLQNRFLNHAEQFTWALQNGNVNTAWTMRMDADEYLTPLLEKEIVNRLPSIDDSISGIFLKRQVHFMGKWIRHGGYYPIRLLRIWRTGHAVIEQRWMDEHILLTRGTAISLKHDFIDYNLNSLSWWTAKHNDYATREAIDILSKTKQYQINVDSTERVTQENEGTKRWYKNNFYLRMPLFLRCFLYFQFRFWIRLGFLDGTKGLIWHFLQGFWYRFLVDAKIKQILWWAKEENKPVDFILKDKYNFDVRKMER